MADALNHTNQFQYDGAGRVVKTTFANNSYVTNIFNLLGQEVAKVDQASNTITSIFDVSGQLTSVVMPSVPDPENGNSPTNPAWVYAFDQFGKQIATLDPKIRATTNIYDQFGREIYHRLPHGEQSTNVYNSLGQLWKSIDFKGQTNQMVYDKFGRIKNKFYFANGSAYPSNAVCYQYNSLGQLWKIIERSGVDATTNSCDGSAALFGNPTGSKGNRYFAALAKLPPEVAGGLSGITLFAMALVALRRRPGFLALLVAEIKSFGLFAESPSAFERRGHLKRFRIPALGWCYVAWSLIICLLGSDPRLDFWNLHAQSCSHPPNASTETTRVTEYSYDFDGHVTQMNCPEGVINYGYEAATGRHTNTCTTNSYIGYGYDELGRLKTVTLSKRNGMPLATNEVTTYTYTAVGNRAMVTLPNGIVTSYQYDGLNRLTNLTHKLGGTNLLASYSYQLHPTGRRTNALEILKTEDSGTPWITNTLTWAYDGMYRLTNELSISTSSAGTYTNAYRYDQVGNRCTKINYQGSITTIVTNLYNENDQLLKEVTSTNNVLNSTNWYAYDVNGSVIARTNVASASSTVLYGYDLKNKLVNVTTNGSGLTNFFLYNDQGIRVRSSVSTDSVISYLIDAHNHTGFQQILEELTTPGVTASRSYVIGDDVLGQATGSTPIWLLYDGHGSTRQVTTGTGSVSSRYCYEAYGSSLGNSTSEAETSLLYCGEQYDSSLGTYNLRARFYCPQNGRFNAMDTFQGNHENPQSLHKYGYVNSDPLNRIDPTGEWSTIDLLVTIAIVSVLASFVIPYSRTGAMHYNENVPQLPNANSPGLTANQNVLIIANSKRSIDELFTRLTEFHVQGADTEGPPVTGIGQRIKWSLTAPAIIAELGQNPFYVTSSKFTSMAGKMGDQDHFMSVVTMGGHPLRGYRFWRVYKSSTSPDIIVETGAVEAPNGWLNRIKAAHGGDSAALRIWESQLDDALAYSGGYALGPHQLRRGWFDDRNTSEFLSLVQ